jgi:hypothetical protein
MRYGKKIRTVGRFWRGRSLGNRIVAERRTPSRMGIRTMSSRSAWAAM